jgi:hypothetical protein
MKLERLFIALIVAFAAAVLWFHFSVVSACRDAGLKPVRGAGLLPTVECVK